MTIQELEPQIKGLSQAEKAELVRQLLREIIDTSPGIEKTPGVAGGEPCIVRTRIPVWVLENYRRLGWSEATILENYPSLRAIDLVNAWSFVDSHPEEIEKAIIKNQEA
jgi:uncharacterized protein (DUF433 family)